MWHEPPPFGEVHYDEEGKPICHVCGMSFDKLIEHTKRKHGLDSLTYRQTYGLMITAQLTSPKYNEMMKQHAYTNETFKENFETTISGITRHTAGRRKGWSEQETKARLQAQINNGKQSKKNLTPAQITELGKIWAKNLPT